MSGGAWGFQSHKIEDDLKPICATCIEVHGRDTNAPIQCQICGRIIGCFWHRWEWSRHRKMHRTEQKETGA
jgi:hypothetical protein